MPLHDTYVMLHAHFLNRGVRVISPAARAAALAQAEAQIRAAVQPAPAAQ